MLVMFTNFYWCYFLRKLVLAISHSEKKGNLRQLCKIQRIDLQRSTAPVLMKVGPMIHVVIDWPKGHMHHL